MEENFDQLHKQNQENHKPQKENQTLKNQKEDQNQITHQDLKNHQDDLILKRLDAKEAHFASLDCLNLGLKSNPNLNLSSLEIYSHPNAPKDPPKYIHFLDSDDYLSLDCISECVKLALSFNAEIIWHDHRLYFQESQTFQSSPVLKKLSLKERTLYRGIDVFKSLPKPLSFSWVAMGIIDFDFLKKHSLSFQKGIESEDALFGMKLFSLAQRIIISYQESYTYRIRPYSISAHTLTKKSKEMKFPESLHDLVCAFKTPYEVRHYSFAYSHCVICLELDAFIQSHPLDEELKEILKEMISYRAIYAFGALSFQDDPRNCRAMCKKLLPYASNIRFSSRLAYYFPKVFQVLKMIQRKIEGE